jgi:hypothetical protein
MAKKMVYIFTFRPLRVKILITTAGDVSEVSLYISEICYLIIMFVILLINDTVSTTKFMTRSICRSQCSHCLDSGPMG